MKNSAYLFGLFFSHLLASQVVSISPVSTIKSHGSFNVGTPQREPSKDKKRKVSCSQD